MNILSGNVREKLKIATSYAETKPEFSINVQALKQIQPQNSRCLRDRDQDLVPHGLIRSI